MPRCFLRITHDASRLLRYALCGHLPAVLVRARRASHKNLVVFFGRQERTDSEESAQQVAYLVPSPGLRAVAESTKRSDRN